MEIYLTTLSNKFYSDSRRGLEESARHFGIDNVFSYNFDTIKNSEFYEHNKYIMSNEKFMGYWLWKPYIISEVLKEMMEGDVLIYVDAGIRIIDKISLLTNICATKTPVMVFGNSNDINSSWVKRDTFILMDCDEEKYWYGIHADAAILIVRKCKIGIQFVDEWLKYGCDKRIITDDSNECGLENMPGFIDHRYDQSILSLLAHKYNFDFYRMPTQFGNHYKMPSVRVKNEFNCVNQSNQSLVSFYSIIPYYNSPYGQCFDHHRTKNKEFIVDKGLDKVYENNDQTDKYINKSSKSPGKFKRLIQSIFNKIGYQLIKI